MGLRVIEEQKRTQRQLYEEEVRRIWENVSSEKLEILKNAYGRIRVKRTLKLLEENVSLEGSSIADLGCGAGCIASLLAEKGAKVTAVDIVNKISNTHDKVSFKQACIPYLSFSDSSFDGIVFADVIAEIDPSLYRLTLSELARLLKRDGWLLCSTPLDLSSEDACAHLIQLLTTEFEVSISSESYHRLYVFLMRWSKAPFRFVRASKDAHYRSKQLQKRTAFKRLWFYLNSTKIISFVWRVPILFLPSFLNLLQNSRRLLLFLERISEILWGTGAMTHTIVLARKKKISYNR